MYKKNGLTSRGKKALDTKKNLFGCATELFRKRGYYNVSVDEIVAKAKISKGTFYNYFKSKDQIILDELKLYDNNYKTFYKKLSKYKTVSEKILVFVKNMFSFTVNEIGFDMLYVVYSTQLSNKQKKTFIVDKNRPFYKIIKQMIQDGQKLGEFRNDISATKITRMSMCCIMGMFFNWCLCNGKFNIIEEGTFFFSQFINSIKKY